MAYWLTMACLDCLIVCVLLTYWLTMAHLRTLPYSLCTTYLLHGLRWHTYIALLFVYYLLTGLRWHTYIALLFVYYLLTGLRWHTYIALFFLYHWLTGLRWHTYIGLFFVNKQTNNKWFNFDFVCHWLTMAHLHCLILCVPLAYDGTLTLPYSLCATLLLPRRQGCSAGKRTDDRRCPPTRSPLRRGTQPARSGHRTLRALTQIVTRQLFEQLFHIFE